MFRHLPETAAQEAKSQSARLAYVTATASIALGVVHEMSQPISAAASFILASQHLLDTGCTDRPALAQTLESASQELKRARDMLMRLRSAISGIGNERLPINVVELAKTIVGQLCNEAEGRDVHISVEPESLPVVMADAAQIRQVLLNLINNAVDAAADASSGIVSVRGFYDSTVVEIEVEDNGKGISSEIADHVFEPFQTTKSYGMGLGLPLSRQIVEAHGGQLWWESVSPHGTRFHLRLPFNGSAGYGS